MPVTNPPPQDTKTNTMTIDEGYKTKALEQVKAMVKGNNASPEDVALAKFDGEVLQFQAETTLTITTKTSELRKAGRVQGPIKMDSTAAVKTAMAKTYEALTADANTEHSIKGVILERADKGFASHNEIIPLPFWKKEFVTYEPCNTCKTTGTVRCMPCAGKGQIICPRCHGSGLGVCTHCNGAQMINGPNNQKTQCPICHGRGKSSCSTCQQKGNIICKTCRSSGTTPCPNCQGNAWTSMIYNMEIEARTAFDYPRDTLPDRASAMIDKHGAKIKDHAKIVVSASQKATVNSDAHTNTETNTGQDFRVPILYNVTLPYGHLEYTIKDKTYYTFLFGTQGRLTHTSPFLDDLIKDGTRKLKDAAEQRGDVTENLKAAAQFRTIKEGIVATALHSSGKAKKMLKASNPLGLSDGALEDIIATADKALKNITKQPRIVGLGISGLISVIGSGLYMMALRPTIMEKATISTLHPIIDIFALGVIAYLGILTIQSTAQSALTKTLNALLPQGFKKSAPPKLGNILYASLGITIASFALFYLSA